MFNFQDPSWNELTPMNGKTVRNQRAKLHPPIRYSEAFKLHVVREVERERWLFGQVQRKYGIGGGGTVARWVRCYGRTSRLLDLRA